ncbi:Alcohol dehydrogenase 2 [Pleurostoma richardsiae]|uniref:alcohol dehydrogenase n=1 Tax=Pleurostoma richardsiae TaxID=41990 RepID=A0AA38W113_9PEZI|nr:Alcohol dehydrogenase 2 [Pleurostoma richardsiae]
MSVSEKTYKAAVLVEQGRSPKFEIRALPLPTLGPTDILVRLSVTSVCGTDCGQAAGELGPTRPVIGHEGVGHIAALGDSVHLIDPTIAVGQRAGVAWNRDACGTCAFCTDTSRDGETRCAGLFQSGRTADGTFAEYAVVPARYLLRIPEEQFGGVPDELVAPVLCGGVTAYKAVKTLDVVPGSWVAVSGGGGGVGAFAVAFAKAMGYRVIAVDAGEVKGKHALSEGAEHFVDITAEEDVGKRVKALTGGLGAGAVIVAAGSGKAYQAAFSMLGPFGTLMCVGIPPADHLVNFHPLFFVGNGWRLVGSAVGTRRDTLEALEFVKRGVVVPKVQWAELSKMGELMIDVGKGKIQGKYVVKLDNL